MKELADRLLGAEPLDLESLLRHYADHLPELLPLREQFVGSASLLTLAQRTMDALRGSPPPAPSCEAQSKPWWTPMPSAYVAALFAHVGLGSLATARRPGRESMPPHARESAKVTRLLLKHLGVPFAVREHAVALILNYRKPENLVGAGSRPETYMRLACVLDLASLHRLREAELEAWPGQPPPQKREVLDEFRRRAEEAAVFGAPPRAPLARDEIAALGHGGAEETHRAANALRYFRLHDLPADREWCITRLRQEAKLPRGRLNLLVGPAGSGKSSWALDHLGDTTIISSDAVRKELTGDAADQSQNYLVFQRCVDRVRSLLKDGKTVTFDATNYAERLRDAPVQAARWCAAETHAYFFDIALDAALKRNLSRQRVVPEQVIQRHFRLLTPPALYEADRHVAVDESGQTQCYWPIGPRQ